MVGWGSARLHLFLILTSLEVFPKLTFSLFGHLHSQLPQEKPASQCQPRALGILSLFFVSVPSIESPHHHLHPSALLPYLSPTTLES